MALVPTGGKIGHRHYLHHHASPTGEVLGSLPFACVGIVLLPCEPGLFPTFEDGLHQICSELGVQPTSLLLVGSTLECKILEIERLVIDKSCVGT